MYRLKKLTLSFFLAGVIALPAGLYGQDNTMQNSKDSLRSNSSAHPDMNMNSSQSSMQDASSNYTAAQLDQALARLNEKPDDNVKTELEGVAETQARDLQTKLGLADDSYKNIKDAINDYLDKRWEDRVELAKQANNPNEYKDKSADLAYLRVDLSKDIKDEIGKENAGKWNSEAVNFWTALDKADFNVKAKEAGIAAGTENSGMNQMNMNENHMMHNNQQNNTDQNNTNGTNTDSTNQKMK
ncbi:MAG TPA: hypothetical protein VMT35_08380 [Ignavibacteriaceae bacterium]|nr:hypothetical protein [Ignavibacteriaceae bacterium]